MIVPLSSPGNPDLTAWATCCNGCGAQHPAGTILHDWVISDDEMDVHYCPLCTRVLAAVLIQEWRDGEPAIRRSDPIRRLIASARSWRGRRTSRRRTDNPES